MNHRKKMAAALIATALIMPLGAQASTDEDKAFSRQIEEAWSDFKDFTVEQKDAAVERGEDLIETLDGRIDELGARAREEADDARARTEDERERLMRLRDSIAERLKKAGEATSDTWQSFKDAVGDAVDSVRERFKDQDKTPEPDATST